MYEFILRAFETHKNYLEFVRNLHCIESKATVDECNEKRNVMEDSPTHEKTQ